MEGVMLAVLVLMTSLTCAEAFSDMNICYILDSILILYGIVLTILYCRVRMKSTDKASDKQKKQTAEKGLYSGLNFKNTDVYETIRDNEKSKHIS
ncbi:Fc receptor, IgE, high affinity I, gamma polypeptide like [Nelusetta ayraudi]|uniref:Fc receptor, IgE, high affinity I, gamma polypeptide like n=1 Tax=Nelusetta ayraudi TaxID=303726 RepID=UPI003F6E461F